MQKSKRLRTIFVLCCVLHGSAVALAQQAQTPRVFDQNSDNRPPSSTFDWRPGSTKAECLSGGPVVGLSANFYSSPSYQAHAVLCRSPISSPLTFFQDNPPSPHHEKTEVVLSGDSEDFGYHPVGGNKDWDPGSFKAECQGGRFVIGVSQTAFTGRIDAVRCSETTTSANVSTSTCHTEMFPGDHEWPSYASPMDWSAGFEKLICKASEVVVGVSTSPTTNHPHAILCCSLQDSPWKKMAQAWPGPTQPETLQLLMDGSILAPDTSSRHRWFRFFPNGNGDYTDGTWKETGSSHFGRSAFVTGMLPDGRFFVGGGEYVFNQSNVQLPFRDRSHCEVYDPVSGVWTNTPDFPGTNNLADGVLSPLTDGTLLVGAAYGSNPADPDNTQPPLYYQSRIFNPSTMTWSAPPQSLSGNPNGPLYFVESSLALMQNNNLFLAGNGIAQYSGGTWQASTSWPPSPFVSPVNSAPEEGSPALVLYDGRVMVTSDTGANAIFNPATGSVRNVAFTPYLGSMTENDQVVMPNGKVLCDAHETGAVNHYFYEYTPPTDDTSPGSFADVSAAGPGFLFAQPGGTTLRSTPLPNGTVMVSARNSKSMFIYTPSGSQLTTYGRPAIDSILKSGTTFRIQGRGLNGLTNGANADDENQNYTSFPVVSMSFGGTVTYLTITSNSTMSISPGVAGVVVANVPIGTPSRTPLIFVISASGLKSAPFTIQLP